MGEIHYKTGSGKNRSPKAGFRKRKSLMAGLGLLCLLAGCAQKEPGQAGDGAEGLEGTPPAETCIEETPPSETWIEETPPAEPPVLTDVLYDKKSKPMVIQFLFSDGELVEKKLDDTFGEAYYAHYDDMTGDGTEEVVIYRHIDATAERYNVLDIFQVDGKEIRQLFPTDDIEGLSGNVCDEDIFLVDRNGRKGNGLHVKIYHEKNEQDEPEKKVLQMTEEMDLFFEDGRWIRLPERELHVEVSLESDSPEAEAYEAFLRGECEAAFSGQCYSHTSYLNPMPPGRESFSFQEMLDMIVSGIRADAAVDGMERVECALIDCGSDGRPELAVRAYGVSIYGRFDDSEVVMIFRCRDGRVELIYSVDCWARSYADIFSDGYVSGRGSDGALDGYVWDGIIGADGVYREYSQRIIGYIPTGEEWPWVDFYYCTLGDEKIQGYYFEEDIPEGARENVMAYIAENEEKMGVKFLPGEEMDRQLDRWAESLGITSEMRERVSREAEGIAWQVVGGCEDYLYGQN